MNILTRPEAICLNRDIDDVALHHMILRLRTMRDMIVGTFRTAMSGSREVLANDRGTTLAISKQNLIAFHHLEGSRLAIHGTVECPMPRGAVRSPEDVAAVLEDLSSILETRRTALVSAEFEMRNLDESARRLVRPLFDAAFNAATVLRHHNPGRSQHSGFSISMPCISKAATITSTGRPVFQAEISAALTAGMPNLAHVKLMANRNIVLHHHAATVMMREIPNASPTEALRILSGLPQTDGPLKAGGTGAF